MSTSVLAAVRSPPIACMLLAQFLLHACSGSPVRSRSTTEAPAIDTAAVPATWGSCALDTTKFLLRRNDTLTTDRFLGPGNTNGLIALTEAERVTYLQDKAALFAKADLYFQAMLECAPQASSITVLVVKGDDRDVLWLSYDREQRLDGLDTMFTTWGDGQYSVEEYAYRDVNGSALIAHISTETVRDGNDTMAYRIDTLIYENVGSSQYVLVPGSDEPVEFRNLQRRPRDLTRSWLVQYPTDDPSKEHRRSLRALIPPGKDVFQAAIGDLNNDQLDDYAYVLQDDPDGERDLLVIFGTHDGRGFERKLFAERFLPERSSGGFHDPIGEPGISGITIEDGHLVITQFGGSASKWQERMVYTYSGNLKGFYLTQQQSRGYHASTLTSTYEDLNLLEEKLAHGEELDNEERERLKEVRKAADDAEYKTTTFKIGEKRLGDK